MQSILSILSYNRSSLYCKLISYMHILIIHVCNAIVSNHGIHSILFGRQGFRCGEYVSIFCPNCQFVSIFLMTIITLLYHMYFDLFTIKTLPFLPFFTPTWAHGKILVFIYFLFFSSNEAKTLVGPRRPNNILHMPLSRLGDLVWFLLLHGPMGKFSVCPCAPNVDFSFDNRRPIWL